MELGFADSECSLFNVEFGWARFGWISSGFYFPRGWEGLLPVPLV